MSILFIGLIDVDQNDPKLRTQMGETMLALGLVCYLILEREREKTCCGFMY